MENFSAIIMYHLSLWCTCMYFTSLYSLNHYGTESLQSQIFITTPFCMLQGLFVLFFNHYSKKTFCITPLLVTFYTLQFFRTPFLTPVTKLPISHTKSAPTQNTGSEAFNPPPHSHDLEHLTASSSYPRDKAFPNSKGHREADSGWPSAAPSTDTEVKTMPQDDEDYDDITIQYTTQ